MKVGTWILYEVCCCRKYMLHFPVLLFFVLYALNGILEKRREDTEAFSFWFWRIFDHFVIF